MKKNTSKLTLSALVLMLLHSQGHAEFTQRWSQQQALENLDNPDVLILDVRSSAEYQSGRVPGAINLPFDQIEERQGELAGWRDKTLLIYCRSGRRAGFAEQTLKRLGFNRRIHLLGDMADWEASKLNVER